MSTPETGTASAALRATVAHVGVLGIAAVAALGVATVVIIQQGVSVASVMTASDASSDADASAGMVGVARYQASYERDSTRIANRDIWNRPAAPPPPPPPPRPEREEPEEPKGPPPPPPPPRIYGGPGIEAMMGDTVWFERGVRLSVGESNSDVEVIATRPPWSATLKWKEVEFEVDYFDRDVPRFWGEPTTGPVFEKPEPEPELETDPETETPDPTTQDPPAAEGGDDSAESTGEPA